MAFELQAALSLLVSLPRNDVALARAAVEAGADALKVHMNVGHRASGTEFGPFESHREVFEAILELGVPVGLVVGGEGRIDLDEVRAARAAGFAFFDSYLHHAPSWYVAEAPERGAMVALAHGAPLDRAAALAPLGLAAVEASLAAPEDYGTPLHLERVADIARLRAQTTLPLVVPSQHALTPADVGPLRAVGADALLIGAVVTGTDEAGVGAATAAFRAAVDEHA